MIQDSITKHEFHAMGCQMAVWLENEDTETAVSACQEAESLFHKAEQWMTRFSADSELSQLNQQAGQWILVSPEMWDICQLAVHLAEDTNGLYDPTILNDLEAAGYTHSYSELSWQTAVSPQCATRKTSFQDIQFDETHQAIKLPDGLRLDLGGIGKGYTAQKVVTFLSEWGPCLVDAGGDLVAGTAPQNYPGWPVGIAAPWSAASERENLLRLWLSESALATSGVDYRRWLQNGRSHHHIINPHTGIPADTDILTVSVLTEDASAAETWATAALIAGLHEGSTQLEERDMGAAFINHDWQVSITHTLLPQVQWEWAN